MVENTNNKHDSILAAFDTNYNHQFEEEEEEDITDTPQNYSPNQIAATYAKMNDPNEGPREMFQAAYMAELQGNNGDFFLNMGVDVEPKGQITSQSNVSFNFDGDFICHSILESRT